MPPRKSTTPDVTLYDKHDYDYSTYWKSREYEHFAEVNTLSRLLANASGTWFIDIGGSYGRHLPLYHKKFHECVIFDYSLNALKQARERAQKGKLRNLHFIAGNVYNMPFKSGVFDWEMMVRVLHHLENAPLAISEISRVARNGGKFVLEFANKKHLKAIARWLLTLNFRDIFSLAPFKVPTLGACEGTSKDLPGIIYNFAPAYIRKTLKDKGFREIKMYPLSFLRLNFLKKHVHQNILCLIERFLQVTLMWTRFTPSVLTLSTKGPTLPKNITFSSLDDIICCPKCKSNLTRSKDTFLCKACGIRFPVHGQIYDLRYPILK